MATNPHKIPLSEAVEMTARARAKARFQSMPGVSTATSSTPS